MNVAKLRYSQYKLERHVGLL